MFYVTRKWVCDKCGKVREITKEMEGLTKDEAIVLPDSWSMYIDKDMVKLSCDACHTLKTNTTPHA